MGFYDLSYETITNYEKIKDRKIKRLLIYRRPIPEGIHNLLNYISKNKINEIMKKLNFDYLFHLYLIMVYDNNEKYILEKNEKPEIRAFKFYQDTPEKINIYEVDIKNKNLTLGILWDNLHKKVNKEDIYIYDPFSANCQIFLLDVLKSSDLLTEDMKNFIYQDVSEIAENTPYYQKLLMKFTTSLLNYLTQT